MMRVVLDTNVFLSAALGGTLKAVIEHWRAGFRARRHRRDRTERSMSLNYDRPRSACRTTYR